MFSGGKCAAGIGYTDNCTTRRFGNEIDFGPRHHGLRFVGNLCFRNQSSAPISSESGVAGAVWRKTGDRSYAQAWCGRNLGEKHRADFAGTGEAKVDQPAASAR